MLRQLAALLLVGAGLAAAEAQDFEPAKPAAEHELLKRFAGEWVCENSASMSPD